MTASEWEALPLHADEPLGLYIHIPFCLRKCVYCDFNTYAGLERIFGATVDALCTEIRHWGVCTAGAGVDTVFFGGGTPTILESAQLHRLQETIRNAFTILPGCEFTSEANPNTVDTERFAALVHSGVNRISIGAQSFHNAELELLGRWHTADTIAAAVAAARTAGVTNLNLDLMHGLPGQTLAAWRQTLEQALALEVEHLSLYALTVEPRTPLHRMVQRGQVPVPDADLCAEQYQVAQEMLAGAGFVQYEIANWSRSPDPAQWSRYACRHNLKYWRNQSYLGIGPGAHSHWRAARPYGRAREWRWWNLDAVPRYNRCLDRNESPIADRETLDPELAQAETMMLGLRLVQEGVTYDRFRRMHDRDLRTTFADALAHLATQNLLAMTPARVQLSSRGILFHNYVSQRFLPAVV